jgi:hypothetical protein
MRGAQWRMIRLIPTIHRGFASATPSQNRVTDWASFTRLMWDGSKIKPLFDPGEDVDMDALLLPSFSPSYTEGSLNLITTKPDTDPVVGQLKVWHQTYGWKWWLLHPYFQSKIRDTNEVGPLLDQSSDILQSNGGFIINRGMQTPLTLPNGQITYPQQNIPPMSISYVQLAYEKRFGEVCNETNTLLSNVAQEEEIPEADTLDELVQPTGAGRHSNALSLSLVRGMQFNAQDRNAYRLMHRRDVTTLMADADFERNEQIGKLVTSTIRPTSKVAGSRRTARKSKQVGPRQQAKALAENASQADILGVKLVDRLVNTTSDGGLGYMYAMLNEDDSHATPSERYAMLHFALSNSPLWTYIVDKCIEETKKGERVLIVVNSPFMQQ